MTRYDERLELAPRDIVARSIDAELKKRGDNCAFLDILHLSKEELQFRYPNIYQGCLDLGIDIAVEVDSRCSCCTLFLWRSFDGFTRKRVPYAISMPLEKLLVQVFLGPTGWPVTLYWKRLFLL